MKLESVLELKRDLIRRQLRPLRRAAQALKFLSFASQHVDQVTEGIRRTVALGVALSGRSYRLAIRIQRPELVGSALVEAIIKQARGEVDVRFIGSAGKFQGEDVLRKKTVPLIAGASIGHETNSGGSIGCFATRVGDASPHVISNNHVLANENSAAIGSHILQQALNDGGTSANRVAKLVAFHPLSKTKDNLADAAIAKLTAGTSFDAGKLLGIGTLKGLRSAPLSEDLKVMKAGKATGVTRGKVTAVSLDNVVLGYGPALGSIGFDDVIEIESEESGPFAVGGDSGSLVVDSDPRAIGIVFGGSSTGSSNGLGLTFVNPIGVVLSKLQAKLLV